MVVRCDGAMITIIVIIGTYSERGSRLLAVGAGRSAGRCGGWIGAAGGGRREPPSEKAVRPVGGRLSDREQLRFKFALGKTVAWGNPLRMEAA